MPQHPGLADSGDSLVGVHLDVRQVAPRRPDHVCADSGDAHGSSPLAAVVDLSSVPAVRRVRYFVTRSKCWRDSKDGVVGVSMGRAHNGFDSFETYGHWSAPNLHSKA
ncbi:hypothetical protein GCM10010261_05590 [Streptomyces pilosus]|uniref:Uncharacterized protein n=1 Tax=Streptomyces pilosus TaxID=28893 RepID=A0A918BF86_9ACTN|nr:hypothetical protein GCM10010280_05980 [Streptomyces pilosus]GGV36058.1 hypothetical protein GCM10010261_05590 [Streptomyces pilosus]